MGNTYTRGPNRPLTARLTVISRSERSLAIYGLSDWPVRNIGRADAKFNKRRTAEERLIKFWWGFWFWFFWIHSVHVGCGSLTVVLVKLCFTHIIKFFKNVQFQLINRAEWNMINNTRLGERSLLENIKLRNLSVKFGYSKGMRWSWCRLRHAFSELISLFIGL